jgi:hypothetical protein
MNYKFEDLEVWQLSLELNDMIYQVSSLLPETEKTIQQLFIKLQAFRKALR